MTLRFSAIDTELARGFQNGQPDAYGNPPELSTSDGGGNPCRHCLNDVPDQAGMLVLAFRPFGGLHPYAETGPIFLCADKCTKYDSANGVPPVLKTSPDYLIKGYSTNDRIVYGTGQIVKHEDMESAAEAVFRDANVSYIHVRSARNNCYQARIDRG